MKLKESNHNKNNRNLIKMKALVHKETAGVMSLINISLYLEKAILSKIIKVMGHFQENKNH